MNRPADDNAMSMAEEIKSIESGLARREEQLVGLEKKLDAAIDELGLDLSAVELPQNTGAILDQPPRKKTMPEPEEEVRQEEEAPVANEIVEAPPEESPQLPQQVAPGAMIRDPAVVELLNQSAGMAQRQEHTRVSVENLDKKVDALARELHRWREEDDRREAQKLDRKSLFWGMSSNELKRLTGMGILFLLIAIVWHLIVN